MACSIARTWSVIGEAWTPLILRDLTLGLRRFDEIKTDLGVAPNILSDRLRRLEQEGVVERRPYSDGGRTHHEYHLTDAGEELVPVLVVLTGWGDRWLADQGPPAIFAHSTCGHRAVSGVVVCSECGSPITLHDTRALPGPGEARGPGTNLIARAERARTSEP